MTKPAQLACLLLLAALVSLGCERPLPVDLTIVNTTSSELLDMRVEIDGDYVQVPSLDPLGETDNVVLSSSPKTIVVSWTDDLSKRQKGTLEKIVPSPAGVLEAWRLEIGEDAQLSLERLPISSPGA